MVLAAIALVLVLSVVGLTRLTSASGLQQIFVSGSDNYLRYEAMQKMFPSRQSDAIVVVSDDALMSPERLEALRDLQFELSFVDGVENVVSLFSVRRASADGQSFPPLIPDEIPTGAAFDDLVAELVSHPLARNHVISADGKTALFTVGLNQELVDGPGLHEAVGEIRSVATAALGAQGLAPLLTGAPVMRAEIDTISERDRIVLNVGGILVGTLVCLFYFQRLLLAAVSALAPTAAIVFTYGVIGWLGIPITVVLVIVAPLVIIVAFTNAMHLLFGIISEAWHDTSAERIGHAVRRVGPACLMTTLTTAIAFSALTLTDSEVIETFGAVAALGAIAAFFAVVTIVPAVASLSMRLAPFRPPRRGASADEAVMARVCAAMDRAGARHSVLTVAIGIVLFLAFAIAQTTLDPSYRLSDNVPRTSETRETLAHLDSAVGGSQQFRVLAHWTPGDGVAEDSLVAALRDAETRLSDVPTVASVLSLATLAGWLEIEAPDRPRDLAAMSDALPDPVRARFVDRETGHALIAVMIPELPTDQTRRLAGTIESTLSELESDWPGLSFELTGMLALTATETSRIIRDLQISLLVAVTLIIGLIGLIFRGVRPAILSTLPNLFPIAASGAWLALSGGTINLAEAIAMTIAFGMAVDDTIHMLYRFRHEQVRGWSNDDALARTVAAIGPVLVLTTVALVAGLAVMFLSPLPMNHDFAQLTIVILAAALAGDLILLPALIRVFGRWLAPPRARARQAT